MFFAMRIPVVHTFPCIYCGHIILSHIRTQLCIRQKPLKMTKITKITTFCFRQVLLYTLHSDEYINFFLICLTAWYNSNYRNCLKYVYIPSQSGTHQLSRGDIYHPYIYLSPTLPPLDPQVL